MKMKVKTGRDFIMKVKVKVDFSMTSKTNSQECNNKHINANLSKIRSLACCVLSSEVRQRHEPLFCLEALDKSGCLTMSWKTQLKDQIHATVADPDIDSTDIQQSCHDHDLTCSELPLNFSRVPGDPLKSQHSSEIFTAKCTAEVVLHMEAFDFIYLNQHNNLVTYIDPAVRNLRHNGLLCLTSRDISSKFTRSADVISRHYGATVIKTSYMRELALRIIIANIVRAAARYNKGVEVLLSLCVNDQYLIVVRMIRGPKEADKSVQQIVPVLHCQICEERVLLPNTKSPQEEPYKLLPCCCYSNNPGKTAVILGPIWSGDLFNIPFIDTMLRVNGDAKNSESVTQLLNSVLEEAMCTSIISSVDMEPDIKRAKLSDPDKPMPVFYFNLPSMKLKAVEHPKFSKLMEYLRQDGYKCSRTHLDNYGVRTNATLKQLTDILYKYCKKKS